MVAGPAAINSYLNAESPGRLIQSAKSYLASRLFRKTQIFGATYTLEELIGSFSKNCVRPPKPSSAIWDRLW